jgi:hypothetical protein
LKDNNKYPILLSGMYFKALKMFYCCSNKIRDKKMQQNAKDFVLNSKCKSSFENSFEQAMLFLILTIKNLSKTSQIMAFKR